MALELLAPKIAKQKELISEYEQRIPKLKAEFEALSSEHAFKEKELRFVQQEVIHMQREYERLDDKIAKEQERRLADLAVKEEKLRVSSEQYDKLVAEEKEIVATLRKKEFSLAEKEKFLLAENKRWIQNAEDLATASKLLDNDVSKREAQLKKDRETFEAFKKTIEPDLLKITAIKNQNAELIRQLEQTQSKLDHEKNKIQYEKDKALEELNRSKESFRKREEAISEREKAIEKRTQELSDYELEVKAKEIEADKAIKRYKLAKQIEDSLEDKKEK